MNINVIHADMFYNTFLFSVKEAKPPSIVEASPCQFGMIVEVIPVRGAGGIASSSLWRRGASQKFFCI